MVRLTAVALLLHLASAPVDYRLALEVKAGIPADAPPGFFALFQAGTSAATLLATAFLTESHFRRLGPAVAVLGDSAVLGLAAFGAAFAPGGSLPVTVAVAGVQRIAGQSLGKPGCQGLALPLPEAGAAAWRTAAVTLGPRVLGHPWNARPGAGRVGGRAPCAAS